MGKKNNKVRVNVTEVKTKEFDNESKPTKFDKKAIQNLIENFEFGYIFTFLDLEQIIHSRRISKFFFQTLSKDDLWEDLGKLHFQKNFNKDSYKQVTETMKCSSLYLMSNDSFVPINIPFFNDKQIKKVLLNIERLYK